MAEASETGLDLILLPGMAFDHECRRLGHGKGFYDFFLHRYKTFGLKMPILSKFLAQINYYEDDANLTVSVVGLALNEQLLSQGDKIPTDSTDWALDGIVTGDGKIIEPVRPF